MNENDIAIEIDSAPSLANAVTGVPNVIVVEDDLFLGRLIGEQLKTTSIQPYVYTNAEDAIEAMKTIQPSLIILDIFLPHMNGLDALALMRKDPRTAHTPVLVISNTDDAAHRDRAVSLGAFFMIKAISSPDEILAQVVAHLPK